MIRARHYRKLANHIPLPWLAVAPVHSGLGEWRRIHGVGVYLGRRSWEVTWRRGDLRGDLLDAAAGSVAAVGRLLGRRP
jgi:hypothetical protein